MLFVDDKGGEIYELINTVIRNTLSDAINNVCTMPSLHHQEIYETCAIVCIMSWVDILFCEVNANLLEW